VDYSDLAGDDSFTTSVALTPEEAASGAVKQVRLHIPAVCEHCGGRGTTSGPTEPLPCPACNGYGQLTAPRSVGLRIPPGVRDGARLRLAEQGPVSRHGGRPGDLFVHVRVQAPGAEQSPEGRQTGPEDRPAERGASPDGASSDGDSPQEGWLAANAVVLGLIVCVVGMVMRLIGEVTMLNRGLGVVGAVLFLGGLPFFRQSDEAREPEADDRARVAGRLGTVALVTCGLILLLFFPTSAPAGGVALVLASGPFTLYLAAAIHARKAPPPPRRLTSAGVALMALAAVCTPVVAMAAVAAGTHASSGYVWHHGRKAEIRRPTGCVTTIRFYRVGSPSSITKCENATWTIDGQAQTGTLFTTVEDLPDSVGGVVEGRVLGDRATTAGEGGHGTGPGAASLGRLPAGPMLAALPVGVLAWVLMWKVPIWSPRRR
jgi:hypothetical protein